MPVTPRTRARRGLLACAALLLAAAPLTAQEAGANDATSDAAHDSTRVDSRGLRAALLLTGAYAVGGMAVMERVWYRDRERVPFHFYDDNAAYLQVDKFGHAFGAYVQSYVGYHWLRKSGVPRSTSLAYGGALGVLLQAPIEFMDGIHEGWGFSWGDMAANAAGSTLVVVQELWFGEQVAKYKFSYRESRYASMANGYLGTTTLERLLEDYNGHTYWLSLPLASLTGHTALPRWLSIAVGYGAGGMFGEFENIREYRGVAIPETARYRRFLLSLDVGWASIETDSPRLKRVLAGLTFVKLPAPALELSSQGRVRGYWLYY